MLKLSDSFMAHPAGTATELVAVPASINGTACFSDWLSPAVNCMPLAGRLAQQMVSSETKKFAI